MKNQANVSSKQNAPNKLKSVLQKLLSESGVSEFHLSKILNMPSSTFYQLMNAEKLNARVDTLLPIARHFDITIDELIGEKPLRDIVRHPKTAKPVFKKANHKWDKVLFLKCLESVIKLAKPQEHNMDAEFIIDTVKEVYYFTLHKGTFEVDETFVEWLLENKTR